LRAVSAQVLRDGVLAGVAARVAGAGEFGEAVRSRVEELAAASSGDPDVLVFDGSGFGGMREALDAAWDAIRPVATEAMIPAGGGRIVLLAPRPGDAAAAGTRAGLENLARTLSVEWARFQVRPVAILPGAATSPAEVAELVAFLASPAGEYYSGCAFELGTVGR
jgi:NAD(P)-dependent dehydrogenase (short-subunit alcohol dehydrogenase family)